MLTPRSPAGFRDLHGQLLKRDVALYVSTTVPTLSKAIASRLSEETDLWERRVEYLFGRVDAFLSQPAQTVDLGIEWVCPGKVMRGYSVSIFGEGSAGKSTLAEDIAVGLVSGIEVVPGWAPRESRRHRILRDLGAFYSQPIIVKAPPAVTFHKVKSHKTAKPPVLDYSEG